MTMNEPLYLIDQCFFLAPPLEDAVNGPRKLLLHPTQSHPSNAAVVASLSAKGVP
jgi:hypothetical protein